MNDCRRRKEDERGGLYIQRWGMMLFSFFFLGSSLLSLSLEDGLWHHRAQREATKHVHHEWIKLHLFHTSCCWKLIYIFEEEKLLCWGGFSQDEWAPIFSKIPCWVMMNFSIFWNLFCQTFVEDSIRIAISASLLLEILLPYFCNYYPTFNRTRTSNCTRILEYFTK